MEGVKEGKKEFSFQLYSLTGGDCDTEIFTKLYMHIIIVVTIRCDP